MNKNELKELKKSLPEMKEKLTGKRISVSSYEKTDNEYLEFKKSFDYTVSQVANHWRRIRTIINSGDDYQSYIENNKA